MVLGAKVVKFGLGFVSLLIASCSMTGTWSAEVTDKAAIQGYDLAISDEDGACVASSENSPETIRLSLTPKAPCYFLRRVGKVQAFSYEGKIPKTVLIVVGTPISEETRQEWGLDRDLVCGEEIQGIVLSNDGLSLSKTTLSGGVWCRDKGTDEKDFWLFAHEDVQ